MNDDNTRKGGLDERTRFHLHVKRVDRSHQYIHYILRECLGRKTIITFRPICPLLALGTQPIPIPVLIPVLLPVNVAIGLDFQGGIGWSFYDIRVASGRYSANLLVFDEGGRGSTSYGYV